MKSNFRKYDDFMFLEDPEEKQDLKNDSFSGLVCKGNQKSVPLILEKCYKYDPGNGKISYVGDGFIVDSSTGKVVKGQYNKNGEPKYYLVKEGKEFLKRIKGHVSIVCVCGPARTGKSYLISRAMVDEITQELEDLELGPKDAFELGHEVKSHTRGMWIGTHVVKKKDFNILFIDCEGIDALDSTSGVKGDDSIFTLGLLLSSVLVLNTMSVVKRQDLDKLGFISTITERVLMKKKENGEEDDDDDENEIDDDDMKDQFPHLFWVFRDFLLSLGNYKSMGDFIKKMCKKKGKRSEIARDQTIATLNLFKTFNTHTVCPPTAEAEDIQKMQELEDEKIHPDFREQLKECIFKILNIAEKKMVGVGSKKTPINGEHYITLIESYIEAMNDPNTVPTILGTSEAMEEISFKNVKDELVKEYTQKMGALSKLFPMEEEILIGSHWKIWNERMGEISKKLFIVKKEVLMKRMLELRNILGKEESSGDNKSCQGEIDSVFKKIEEKNQSTIFSSGLITNYLHDNSKKSEVYCRKLVKDIHEPVLKDIIRTPKKFTMKGVENLFVEMRKKYFSVAKGPAKYKVFSEYKKQRLENNKREFSQIKGYEEKIARQIAEKEEMIVQKKKADERAKNIQTQYKKLKENQYKMLEDVKREQEKNRKEMFEYMKQREEEEKRRTEDFRKMMFDAIAEQNDSSMKMMKESNEKMMMMMQQQIESSEQNMKETLKAIREMPPPVVNIDGGGGGLCCIM